MDSEQWFLASRFCLGFGRGQINCRKAIKNTRPKLVLLCFRAAATPVARPGIHRRCMQFLSTLSSCVGNRLLLKSVQGALHRAPLLCTYNATLNLYGFDSDSSVFSIRHIRIQNFESNLKPQQLNRKLTSIQQLQWSLPSEPFCRNSCKQFQKRKHVTGANFGLASQLN